MAEQGRDAQPRGVRASPTGRVPQWVLDEARGFEVTPVPFRGATAPALQPVRPARGGRRGGRVLTVLWVSLLTAGALVAAWSWKDGVAPPTSPSALHTFERGYPLPSGEESASPLGTPPDLPLPPEGSGYRFLSHQADGTTPVTFSPCRPVHYVTRPAHTPPGGEALVASAVAEISAATGLVFVHDGATDEAPAEDRPAYQPDRYGDRWAPVLVAWATTAEVPDFGVDIVGEAGPVPVSTPSGDKAYVSGEVLLDPVKMAQISQGLGEAVARSVVVHELGHLVGLAHVDDPAQVMFPRGGDALTLGPGDRAGLAALGRGACQPDV